MFARTKKYIDDHMFEIACGTVGATLAVGFIGVTTLAARVGAQEGFRQAQNVALRLHLDEEKVAEAVLAGIKTIKQAEKAAKIAKEII